MTEDIQVNFVVPKGFEKEECSNGLQQAFAACEQLRDGGMTARWVHEDDCMQLQELTKKEVFVLDDFDGPLFEKLKATKCLLVGPRCLSCCLTEVRPIPSGPGPVFTVAMRGLIVTASGLNKIQKDKIKERIEWMGGLYSNTLTADTTHLVSSTVISDKYIKSVEKGIPVMSVAWVEDVWDTSLRLNVSGGSPEFDKHRLPAFANLHITTSGIGRKEKQLLAKLIAEHGGTFTGSFQSETTDIVIMTKEGVGSEKYKAAVEFGKACVLPGWAQASARRGAAQPLGAYAVSGASTSSPIAPHRLPDISLNFSRITNARPASSFVNETSDASSTQTKVSQEGRRSSVDEDIAAAFDAFDMNTLKQAGPIFDGFFIWVVGGEGEGEGCGSGSRYERLCRVVTRAGGVRYDLASERVSHAVALSAAAAERARAHLPHVPVLSALWLLRSVQARRALDVAQYLMETNASASGGAGKARCAEPASPLSKRNLQMLRPPPPPPLAPALATETPARDAPDDVLQQYKSHTSETRSKWKEPDASDSTQPAEEPTDEQEQILEGVRLEVQGVAEEALCELGAEVAAAGGALLPPGEGGSHALVPLDFDCRDLANQRAQPVTVFWLRDCLTQQELVPVQYFHRPVRVCGRRALHGVVLCLSTYSGVERAFLDELATLLGATTQLRFCRRASPGALASTHLLCPTATGEKYAGALRWGLPAVTGRWLLECAAAGRRLHEQPYLVGDAKAPPVAEEVPDSKDASSDKENASEAERAKSAVGGAAAAEPATDDKRAPNPQAAAAGAEAEAEMSPASRYIAMARQGLLSVDSQETPDKARPQPRPQPGGAEGAGALRTPPLDEALSTPNLRALSPTTRRRIQAVRRGEMPSDPIRTPDNPFEGDAATPDSAFGAALRPGSGPLSPQARKRLWTLVQHLPHKQPAPAPLPAHTPLSEIRNRFLAQFAPGAPTPPSDHPASAPRKLQLQDQADTPPAKVPKRVGGESPSAVKGARAADGVDTQLRRLSAALAGQGTPQHLRLRRTRDTPPTPRHPEPAAASASGSRGADIDMELSSQANSVRWDDGERLPGAPVAASATDAADDHIAVAPDSLPVKRFMLSNNVDNQAELVEMIVSLGGEVCSGGELDPRATHLLCAAPVRSEKMLGAVAAGKWALHPAYVARSRLHGAFLPEEDYEWGSARASQLPAVGALEQAVARAAHRWRVARSQGHEGAFAGLRALLHMPPARKRLLAKLLSAGDGHVVDDAPPYSAEGVTLCLADFKRYPISERDSQWLRERRVPVCPYILLFSYLTDEQPPDPRDHCLPEFRLP